MALNYIWRTHFSYEQGALGGKPWDYAGIPERIADVIAALSGSEGRPTQASVITALNANGYAVPTGAPSGTVLAIKNIAPSSTPQAYGSPVGGGNAVFRVRWHYEVGGKMTAAGSLFADFILTTTSDGRADLTSLQTQIAAAFVTPAGGIIVVEMVQQASHGGLN